MKHLILYSLLFLSVVLFAQEKDRDLPKANEAFDAKKYDEAEANYRISESNNPTKAIRRESGRVQTVSKGR